MANELASGYGVNNTTLGMNGAAGNMDKIAEFARVVRQIQVAKDSGAMSPETAARMLQFSAQQMGVSEEEAGKLAQIAGSVKKSIGGLTKSGKDGQSKLGQFFESIGGMGDRMKKFVGDHPALSTMGLGLAMQNSNPKSNQVALQGVQNAFQEKRNIAEQQRREGVIDSKQKIPMYRVLPNGSVEQVDVPVDQRSMYESKGFKEGDLKNSPRLGESGSQLKGVSEIGDYPVVFNGKNLVVQTKNGDELYDKEKHGQVMSTSLSRTAVYNSEQELERQRRRKQAIMEGIDIDKTANAIANGQAALSTIAQTRGMPIREWLRSEVLQDYPNFNFNMSEANMKYRTNSSNIRAAALAQAALPRVEDLYVKVQDLNNVTGIPLLDTPLNVLRKQFGSTKVSDYNSLRNAIIQEVNTALSGTSVASDFRIHLENENLRDSMTPAQLAESIKNLISALDARTDASTAEMYPLEVVQGTITMDQWKDLERSERKARVFRKLTQPKEDILGQGSSSQSTSGANPTEPSGDFEIISVK